MRATLSMRGMWEMSCAATAGCRLKAWYSSLLRGFPLVARLTTCSGRMMYPTRQSMAAVSVCQGSGSPILADRDRTRGVSLESRPYTSGLTRDSTSESTWTLPRSVFSRSSRSAVMRLHWRRPSWMACASISGGQGFVSSRKMDPSLTARMATSSSA